MVLLSKAVINNKNNQHVANYIIIIIFDLFKIDYVNVYGIICEYLKLSIHNSHAIAVLLFLFGLIQNYTY